MMCVPVGYRRATFWCTGLWFTIRAQTSCEGAFYFTLHWAWVSPGTEKHLLGRSKAEGMPSTCQACLHKAKSLIDKQALQCSPGSVWNFCSTVNTIPGCPPCSVLCVALSHFGLAEGAVQHWQGGLALSHCRKAHLLLAEHKWAQKRSSRWSEKCEDFAACRTGFGSAFTFGCCVSLGQSLNVCFLISEIGCEPEITLIRCLTRDESSSDSSYYWQLQACPLVWGLSFFFLEPWPLICPRVTRSTFQLGL